MATRKSRSDSTAGASKKPETGSSKPGTSATQADPETPEESRDLQAFDVEKEANQTSAMTHQLIKGLKNWPAQLGILRALLMFAHRCAKEGVSEQEIQATLRSVGVQVQKKKAAIAAEDRKVRLH